MSWSFEHYTSAPEGAEFEPGKEAEVGEVTKANKWKLGKLKDKIFKTKEERQEARADRKEKRDSKKAERKEAKEEKTSPEIREFNQLMDDLKTYSSKNPTAKFNQIITVTSVLSAIAFPVWASIYNYVPRNHPAEYPALVTAVTWIVWLIWGWVWWTASWISSLSSWSKIWNAFPLNGFRTWNKNKIDSVNGKINIRPIKNWLIIEHDWYTSSDWEEVSATKLTIKTKWNKVILKDNSWDGVKWRRVRDGDQFKESWLLDKVRGRVNSVKDTNRQKLLDMAYEWTLDTDAMEQVA